MCARYRPIPPNTTKYHQINIRATDTIIPYTTRVMTHDVATCTVHAFRACVLMLMRVAASPGNPWSVLTVHNSSSRFIYVFFHAPQSALSFSTTHNGTMIPTCLTVLCNMLMSCFSTTPIADVVCELTWDDRPSRVMTRMVTTTVVNAHNFWSVQMDFKDGNRTKRMSSPWDAVTLDDAVLEFMHTGVCTVRMSTTLKRVCAARIMFHAHKMHALTALLGGHVASMVQSSVEHHTDCHGMTRSPIGQP